MLRGSKRKNLGFDNKHLVENIDPTGPWELLRRMLMDLIRKFESFETEAGIRACACARARARVRACACACVCVCMCV